MKIIKLSILILLVLNIFISARRLLTEQSLNVGNYDPILAPLVVKAYFSKIIDPAKDTNKLYKECIDLLSDDSRSDQQKRILFNILARILEYDGKTKKKFRIITAERFLKTSNFNLNVNGSTVECGGYLKSIMFSEEDFEAPKIQKSIRSELKRVIGVYNDGVTKRGNKFITHFIGDRRSKFVIKDFFKKLNGNK